MEMKILTVTIIALHKKTIDFLSYKFIHKYQSLDVSHEIGSIDR